jgi:hypothetical protein
MGAISGVPMATYTMDMYNEDDDNRAVVSPFPPPGCGSPDSRCRATQCR